MYGDELLFHLKAILGKPVTFSSKQTENAKKESRVHLPITKAMTKYGYVPQYNIEQLLRYIGEYYGK